MTMSRRQQRWQRKQQRSECPPAVVRRRKATSPKKDEGEICEELQGVAAGCAEPNENLMGDEGLEPPTSAV